MSYLLRFTMITALALALAAIGSTWAGSTVGPSAAAQDATPSPVTCVEEPGTATPESELPDGLTRVLKGDHQSDQMSEIEWNGTELPLILQWGKYEVAANTTFRAAESSGFTITVLEGVLTIEVCEISPTGKAAVFTDAVPTETLLMAGQPPIDLQPGELAMFAGATLVISTGSDAATFVATGITLGDDPPCPGRSCWEPPCNSSCPNESNRKDE